jgi:hypothetical protein
VDGTAVDASAELPKSDAFPNGLQFSGLDGAQQTVASDPRFQTCITEKLYTYGLGRALSTEDKANAAAITKVWQGGPQTVSKLLHNLAVSEPFRSRTPAM